MNLRKPLLLQLIELCCLLLAGVLVAPLASAQGYFRVSPGPLNEGHAAYDNSESCPKCHESGTGVTNQRCLSCHGAVAHKGGLHATFGTKPCIACHTEHKGRAFNIIDWKNVGGRDSFKHETTGFSLTEHHAQVACAKCHVKRLKTGRISYLGLSADCNSCHSAVHGFTRPELSKKCEDCHKPGQSLRGQVLRNWGKHAQYSSLNLEGKHVDRPCVECHKSANFGRHGASRVCADCHAPTHPITAPTKNCVECHAQSSPFKGAKINHNKFDFPLAGRHARVACASCHLRGKKAGPGVMPGTACVDCHTPSHPVTRATANCASCHPLTNPFKGASIDHAKFGFPLLGEHSKKSCASCHKGKGKLKYSEGACTTCHTHRNAHQGQFRDKPCASCHVEGGKRDKPFDHNVDTKFPLTGFHGEEKLKSDCVRCHPGRIYRTGKLNCVDCHEDKHKGELGPDCTKCHSPFLHFNAPRSKDFDHSRFPLHGKHKTIPCISCHVNSNYKLGHRTCYDCHKKDDRHLGRLGQDCGKCHGESAFKPAGKFSHDFMTKFPRTGAHRTTSCALCHQPKTSQQRALSVAEWKEARKTIPSRLPLTFPVRGSRCIDCHSDPHNGNVGTDCAACHSTRDFRAISGGRAKSIRPRDHGGSWLRRHTTLPPYDSDVGAEKRSCANCHGAPSCSNCHRTRAARSHTALWRIRTHGAAAAFDSNTCSTCHRAASCMQCHRRTPPLNHRGAWRTMHGYAAGSFVDNNCFVCHRRSDCALCHRTR